MCNSIIYYANNLDIFFLNNILEMIPRHGAKNGIQNLIITLSGFCDKIYLADFHQLKGLIELINGDIL